MVSVNYGLSPLLLDMVLSDVSPSGAGCSSAKRASKQPQRRIPVDVYEKDSEFEIVADVPGVAKEAIHLDIDKDTLTISVSQPKAQEAFSDAKVPRATDGDTPAEPAASGLEQPDATEAPAQPKLLRRERAQRLAKRALKLPDIADLGQARAERVAGVLTVMVPKQALPSPHRIPIA